MSEIFSRNIMYWGEKTQKMLREKHVFIFGLGGVGGYTADALARAGIGEMTLVDFDTVSESNINRQIIAAHSSVGKKKTELFRKRLLDINPDIKINIFDDFYSEEKNEEIFKTKADFVVDAIDTQRAKVDLLVYCCENRIPVASSMGAGNRIDPTQLFISDISEVQELKCSFVQNIIYNLNKRNVQSGIIGVFSKEKPKKPLQKECSIIQTDETGQNSIKKYSPSSTPLVPPVAGYYLAYTVINKLCSTVDKKS